MKCNNCSHFYYGVYKDLEKREQILMLCKKTGQEVAHDELDKNGYPAWCPLNQENDIKPTEDCQHSENKPQEKCQFPPEIPDSIAGIPVSDLLLIAQVVGGKPRLLEEIKDGYAFGHAVGYKAGFELFEKKLHEAVMKINSEPLRFEQEGDFDFTKVKLKIPPYKQQDEVINMARLYGVPVYTPKVINVVNPSTDGDDNK